MKDRAFADISLENEDITVEDYLRMQCEFQIAKLMQHTQLQIETFKKEAEKVKKEFKDIMGVEDAPTK